MHFSEHGTHPLKCKLLINKHLTFTLMSAFSVVIRFNGNQRPVSFQIKPSQTELLCRNHFPVMSLKRFDLKCRVMRPTKVHNYRTFNFLLLG